ncbi:MAG: RHS repeat-associated core domain-containing protein, partial [Oscillospiraceae bacterium]|nr:RHS repeat-associated core domain-containing protein [Oscillospiraceae bacterium]
MTEIVRGDGMKYLLTYNAYHNLEAIGINGKSEKLVKYTYKNGNCRLKTVTYANGHTMKVGYNTAGQMTYEKWYASKAASESSASAPVAYYKYVYDGQGNIVRSIDLKALKEYTYTYEDGKIVRAAEYDITLDANEFVTSKAIVNTVFYVYGEEDKLIRKRIVPAKGAEQVIYYESTEDNTVVKFNVPAPTEADAGKTQTITSHSKTDAFGRKEFDELQIGTGFVARQFHYHSGEVTEEHKDNDKLKSSATTQLVSQIVLSGGRTISYEYDAEERITKVTDSVEGTTEYTYDALGQLVTETVNGQVINTMTYDNYGNIRTKNGIAYTYGNAVWKDLLTSYNGQTITYDAQGNPTSYLGHTLTWEKGRQLKSFGDITYTYNANGIRTSKTVDGIRHEFMLDGNKILCESWENNTLISLYDNEDSVCGVIYNNVPYYFHKNQQGDIIAIVNKEAETVARYSYDAWGVCTIVQDSSGVGIAAVNPYRYRGYYFDKEIGLYYLQSRYYDPEIGRFVNGDESTTILLAQNEVINLNLFSYCKNSPIIFVDDVGLFSFDDIKKFLNKIISGL